MIIEIIEKDKYIFDLVNLVYFILLQLFYVFLEKDTAVLVRVALSVTITQVQIIYGIFLPSAFTYVTITLLSLPKHLCQIVGTSHSIHLRCKRVKPAPSPPPPFSPNFSQII